MQKELLAITELAKKKRDGIISQKELEKFENIKKEMEEIFELEKNPLTLYALQERFFNGEQWDIIAETIGKPESDAIRKACYRSYNKNKKIKQKEKEMKTTETIIETLEQYKDYKIKIGSLDTPFEEMQTLSKIIIDPTEKTLVMLGDYNNIEELQEKLRKEWN